jgi:DNA-binding transcriptional ArsR family regulator
MDKQTQDRFELRAGIVKAMAQPTRLFMVEVLSRGEKCVCELTDMVGADISTISKHLSVLKSAGIVGDEKRGSQVWYRLRCPCVMGFLTCVESVLESNEDLLKSTRRC